MNDKDLFNYCRNVGKNARMWKNRFIALLPEVAKRNLHKKHGFASVCEFAFKLGGITKNNVDAIFRVHQHIKDKPALQEILPKVGVNKVRVIATMATKENQKDLAKKVQELSKSALEMYARNFRPGTAKDESESSDSCLVGEQVGLFEQGSNSENFSNMSRDENREKYSFEVDKETDFQLKKIRKKLERKMKRTVTWCEVMKYFVQREQELEKPKRIIKRNKSKKISQNAPKDMESKQSKKVSRAAPKETQRKTSRTAPKEIQRNAIKQYKERCAIIGCDEPFEELHHPDRYKLKKSHERIVPLCKTHHELAHNGLIKNEHLAPVYWKIQEKPDKTDPKYEIDKLVKKFRLAYLL